MQDDIVLVDHDPVEAHRGREHGDRDHEGYGHTEDRHIQKMHEPPGQVVIVVPESIHSEGDAHTGNDGHSHIGQDGEKMEGLPAHFFDQFVGGGKYLVYEGEEDHDAYEYAYDDGQDAPEVVDLQCIQFFVLFRFIHGSGSSKDNCAKYICILT